MRNLILSKYVEIIYHMIALLLYVLNMQENSRFSLGEGCYNRTSNFATGKALPIPLALELGLPLKNPSSQSEYSRSVRSAMHDIKVAAQNKLAASRRKQTRHYDSHRRKWVPFPSGSSVWLRRLKTWKFGGKWVGPYEVLSCKGVIYKLRSKEGKEVAAHHNNLKGCTSPADKGVPY